MGIFDDIKAKGAAYRLTEEALYAEALREIESGQRRDGIWAKAMAESNMDHGKAGARYIKLRVQSLKDEVTVLISGLNKADPIVQPAGPPPQDAGQHIKSKSPARAAIWIFRLAAACGMYVLWNSSNPTAKIMTAVPICVFFLTFVFGYRGDLEMKGRERRRVPGYDTARTDEQKMSRRALGYDD